MSSILKDLNFVKRLLVCRVRHNSYVVRVKFDRYKLRANAIVFDSLVRKVYDMLSPHREDLDEVLAFIFTGPTQPAKDDL